MQSWPHKNPVNTSFTINKQSPFYNGLVSFASSSAVDGGVIVERVNNKVIRIPSTVTFEYEPRLGRWFKPSTDVVGKFSLRTGNWDINSGTLLAWCGCYQQDYTYRFYCSFGWDSSNFLGMRNRNYEMWHRTKWNGSTLEVEDTVTTMVSGKAYLSGLSWSGGSGGTLYQTTNGIQRDSGTIPDNMVTQPTMWFCVGGNYAGLYPMDVGWVGDVMLWNRKLSHEEIRHIYQNPWELYSSVISTRVAVTVGVIVGDTTWGHDTGVTETNIRDFSGNWTGTGSILGTGDSERLELNAGEYMVSEIVNTGAYTVTLFQNHYDGTGDNVTLEYRHADSEGDISSASYNTYSGSFTSLGYVQIRVTSTL